MFDADALAARAARPTIFGRYQYHFADGRAESNREISLLVSALGKNRCQAGGYRFCIKRGAADFMQTKGAFDLTHNVFQ